MSPLVLLSASATVVLALFCIALAAKSARQRPGNTALLLLLTSGALLVARATARGLGWVEPTAVLAFALALFAALPPLAALYARGVLTRQRLSRRDWRHTAAPLVALAAVGGTIALTGGLSTLNWWAFAIALQLVALGYGAWALGLWRTSDSPSWASGVLATFAIHWAFSAAAWFTALAPGVSTAIASTMEAFSMLALLAFGGAAVVSALRQTAAFAPEPPAPYARTGTDTSQRQRLASRLRETVAQESPHLDPDLSAAGLASLIGATPRELSEVLTCEIGESFFEFVAGLRVEEAKRALSDPERADDTILEIIYASGFNSKSAFHRAFRGRVGQTPSAFRREALEQTQPARRAA